MKRNVHPLNQNNKKSQQIGKTIIFAINSPFDGKRFSFQLKKAMENKKYDVFISYSSHDQKIAEGICGYLESNDYRCFVAYRDILPGVVWARAITEALDNSCLMVVVFSDEYNESEQTDREIEMASENKMPIIPYRITNANLTGAKKYYLKNINWIDASSSPEGNFERLLESVKRLVPHNFVNNDMDRLEDWLEDWPEISAIEWALMNQDKTVKTTTDLLKLEFWTGFNDAMKNNMAFTQNFRLHKAAPQHYYDLSIGSSSYHIGLTINTRKQLLGAEIYIDNNKAVFEIFKAHSDEISKLLDNVVEWRDAGKASRILTTTKLDPREKSNWDKAYNWFLEKALVLKSIALQFGK